MFAVFEGFSSFFPDFFQNVAIGALFFRVLCEFVRRIVAILERFSPLFPNFFQNFAVSANSRFCLFLARFRFFFYHLSFGVFALLSLVLMRNVIAVFKWLTFGFPDFLEHIAVLTDSSGLLPLTLGFLISHFFFLLMRGVIAVFKRFWSCFFDFFQNIAVLANLLDFLPVFLTFGVHFLRLVVEIFLWFSHLTFFRLSLVLMRFIVVVLKVFSSFVSNSLENLTILTHNGQFIPILVGSFFLLFRKNWIRILRGLVGHYLGRNFFIFRHIKQRRRVLSWFLSQRNGLLDLPLSLSWDSGLLRLADLSLLLLRILILLNLRRLFSLPDLLWSVLRRFYIFHWLFGLNNLRLFADLLGVNIYLSVRTRVGFQSLRKSLMVRVV